MNRFLIISPNLLCILNNGGHFVELNQVWEGALGYPRGELRSKSFLDLVHPDDIERTRGAMAPLASGHEVHFENRYLCQDGSYRWMEWHAKQYRGLIYAVGHDVTERKRTERSLKERLEFETLLADLSGHFVNIPPDQVDREIDATLHEICEHLDFDVAGLWQWTIPAPQYLTLTNLYRRLDGPPTPERIDAEELFPWTFQQATAGKIVAISVDDFPPEAARDQEISRRFGIKSSLTFPLRTWNDKLIGAVVFSTVSETRSWPEDLIRRLQLVAQIFANALARKLADIALSESEERLGLASASANVGLWALDLETHQFWTTDKGLELFGIPPGRTMSFDDFIKLVHHEDRDKVCQVVDQAPGSDYDEVVEYRIVKADGSMRWMASRGQRRMNSKGEAKRLMGITQDITDWKHAEAAASEARSLIAALVESTNDLIWSVDPEKFGLLTFNSALSNYFFRGLKLKISLGMSPEDMVTGAFTPLVAEKWRQFYLRALREGPFTEEYRVATGDRTLLLSFNLLERSGEVFAISVFGKDITERKDMERTIRRAAREWQTTFDNIPDLVMILSREFKIVRINAAVLSRFGRPKEEIIGTQCYTLMHGEDKPCDVCPFMKTLVSRKHEEAEFYDSTRETWLLASTDPILGDDGEVLQVIHILRDITGLKKAEAETFAVRKEFWRTDRLLRMGELTASLAHELNQPLTSILSNARAGLRFIDSGTIDINELKDILNDIAHDDKRAGEIIRSLRSMVKHEEGERTTVSLNDVVREAVVLFHSESVIRDISVETRLLETLPMVNIDVVQIEQVLLNLMMNAMEAMPDEVRDRKISLRSEIGENHKVRVAVSDRGTGIPAEELPSVFEAFFTTKQSGLGMGLSLSRSIIEGHGGSIWAENNPDKGATFFIELPITEGGDR
jgi:PAS domain S-box-containing protein